MKKIIAFLFLLPLCALAQTNPPSSGIGGIIGGFFANNPSNQWDVSAYVIRDDAQARYGPGLGVAYWLMPSVGTSLDLNYIDGDLSFASLGINGRGTFKLGSFADVTSYAKAGPGWIFRRGVAGTAYDQRVVAIASAGVSVDIKAIDKYVVPFGEWRHVFEGNSNTVGHNQILVGLSHRF